MPANLETSETSALPQTSSSPGSLHAGQHPCAHGHHCPEMFNDYPSLHSPPPPCPWGSCHRSWKTTEEIKWKHKSATPGPPAPLGQAPAPQRTPEWGSTQEASQPSKVCPDKTQWARSSAPGLPASGPVHPSSRAEASPPQEDLGHRA